MLVKAGANLDLQSMVSDQQSSQDLATGRPGYGQATWLSLGAAARIVPAYDVQGAD